MTGLAPRRGGSPPTGRATLAGWQGSGKPGLLLLGAMAAALLGAGPTLAQEPVPPDTTRHPTPEMDTRARMVEHDRSVFGPDPDYGDIPYDYQAQLDIYGAKYLNRTQRPLLELGRRLYHSGPFRRLPNLLGDHNVIIPQLLVYGDLRIGSAYNAAATEIGTVAGRLNLDVDLKLTATERIHALFRPLDDDGEFTRFDFLGDSTGFKDSFDPEPNALFFEGDLGAILGGLSGRDAPFDMPVAAGLMPLLFHNGVWVEDAFTGGAFTLPSRNSRLLDWSNFDITFFAGFDRVSNPALPDAEDAGRLFGVNTFIEAYQGYAEVGYAFLSGDADAGRDLHSVALSFTRRYGTFISNSIRYIGAFAQDSDPELAEGGGHLVLWESSLITSRPYTVVPYLNLFFSVDHPVSAARNVEAGGILKTTGINFETDGLTGFPTLDPTAENAAGGALGINLLGSRLNRQLVLEAAATFPWDAEPEHPGAQFGFGLRAQHALTNALLVRVDGMYGLRGDLDDVKGARLELRHKF